MPETVGCTPTKSAPRSLYQAAQTGCIAIKESPIVPRRGFGRGQELQRRKDRLRQFHLNRSVILDGAFHEIGAPDVAALTCVYTHRLPTIGPPYSRRYGIQQGRAGLGQFPPVEGKPGTVVRSTQRISVM
jgi:hypothetical protein